MSTYVYHLFSRAILAGFFRILNEAMFGELVNSLPRLREGPTTDSLAIASLWTSSCCFWLMQQANNQADWHLFAAKMMISQA